MHYISISYPKAAFGFRGNARVGLDREFPTFQRKSVKLKKALLAALDGSVDIEIAQGYESPEELVEKSSAAAVLISPYVKELFKDVDRSQKELYFLTEKEFNSEDTEKIIAYLNQ